MKKAQISVEYLTVIGFILVLVALSFVYASILMQQQSDLKKSFTAAQTLRNAINEVHSLAPGSKMTIEVILPSEVKESYVNGKEAGWIIDLGNSDMFAVYETDANVVGLLSTNEGINYITLEVLASGTVQIGQGLTLSPEATTITVLPGTSEQQKFILTNESNRDINGITARIEGDLNAFASIESMPLSLNQGSSGEIIVDFNVPNDTNAQTIYGFLIVNSAQNYSAESLIILRIPHILDRIQILTYGDEDYSILKQSFLVSERVYYEARFYDDKNNLIDLEDLNVFVKDPNNTIQEQKISQVTDNGVYRNSYLTDCASANGTWTIQVDANNYNFVSDSNTFTMSGGSEAGNFTFDWSEAEFEDGGKKLKSWLIANYTSCGEITIDKMKVEWLNDTDNAKLKEIKINKKKVWNGNEDSGVWLNITDTALPNSTEYTKNELKFTKNMNNESEDIKLTFEFIDGSTYETEWFTP